MAQGSFVFTSNVDGQFQKAGFADARIQEVHGTIHKMQCLDGCCSKTWSAEAFKPVIDETACQLLNDLPRCPHCGALARPNILMFGDWTWVDRESSMQYDQLQAWLATVKRLVVVEMGAGKAISTVRRMSERNKPRIIRINPRDFDIKPEWGVGLSSGTVEALQALDALL
jgi:NAD-dependent SIR2 family protein deacetylase